MTEGHDPIDADIRFTTVDDGIDKIALVIDGSEVSWALFSKFNLGFGASTIPMVGIGGVETGEAYRNKGYSRRVMQATVRHIEQSDVPLLTLFGIPNFYHRFEFLPLGPDYMLNIRETATLPALGPQFTVRVAQDSDLPAVQEIWRCESRGLSGHVIRDDRQRSWQSLRESIATKRDDCRVVIDARGTVQGYAWLVSHHWYMEGFREEGRNNLDIGEAGARTPAAADAVLAMLPAWRDDLGKNDIILAIPHRHNSVGRAAQLRDVNVKIQYSVNESYMGRTTGSDDLIRALLPEFVNRWRSCGSSWQGTIDFAVGEERTRLALGTSVSVGTLSGTADCSVTMTPGEFARLVFCAFSPEDLLVRCGADDRTVTVASSLFPQQATCIYPADRF
jgi:predicted N-acetyltransferase YhbS